MATWCTWTELERWRAGDGPAVPMNVRPRTALAGGFRLIDLAPVLLALLILGLGVTAYMTGRKSHSLARMEVTAAVQVAKQEVGWQYERYRIQALRMDWVALEPSARKEYVRTWGRPSWAGTAPDPDPLEGVPKVHRVRGRSG